MSEIQSDDKDIRTNVERFEAAARASKVEFEIPRIDRILLVLDGSNQDATSEGLATVLARSAEAELRIFAADGSRRDPDRKDYLDRRAEALRENGIRAEVEALEKSAENLKAYEQILAAAERTSCDLMVLCAPYLEDFDSLGRESVGTTLDILMCRSAVPVLAAREPRDDPGRCLEKILLPITPFLDPGARAAAWTFRLVREGGHIQLLAITGDEWPETPTDMPENAEIRVAAGLHRAEAAGLIAAMQRRSAEAGLGCRMDLASGEVVKVLAEWANREELTVVVPCCPRDPVGTAYQRVQALVRELRNPVLIV